MCKRCYLQVVCEIAAFGRELCKRGHNQSENSSRFNLLMIKIFKNLLIVRAGIKVKLWSLAFGVDSLTTISSLSPLVAASSTELFRNNMRDGCQIPRASASPKSCSERGQYLHSVCGWSDLLRWVQVTVVVHSVFSNFSISIYGPTLNNRSLLGLVFDPQIYWKDLDSFFDP